MKQKQFDTMQSPYIRWFKDIRISDIHLVGGKNASLGEMYSSLTTQGVRVPNGFAITVDAYADLLASHDLEKKIKQWLKSLDEKNIHELKRVGKKIRTAMLAAEFSPSVVSAITDAYTQLVPKKNLKMGPVAVRSSATAEDLPDASFAGQQETFLNVRGIDDVLLSVKRCMASLFTDRAISYRAQRGFDHLSVSLSVTVQQMVQSETGASGVMFTMDTESGFRGVVLVSASYGLGEYVVQGRVTPDQYYVFKESLVKHTPSAIISKTLGSKEVKLVYGKHQGTKHQLVPLSDRKRFALSDNEVMELARAAVIIEKHYGRPQDIEWAKDGKTGELFIVQARPETVKTMSNHAVIETYSLKKEGKVLLKGTAVGQRIGAGPVRIITSLKDMKHFRQGDVLVTRITDPDWEPIMRIASAVITEQGGKTSHAAIVSRELGVPAIVGAKGARSVLKNKQLVTASCANGDDGVVYKGVLPFEVQKTELIDIPKTKTQIMMNVGDPDHAFSLSFLPHDGVGLTRLEFIFANFIRIHPLALLQYNDLEDPVAKKHILDMTKGYTSKAEYGIQKLTEGIARIAAAMYPRDVVVRLSDFKTNEYASLIGGKQFEPKEENPMLGWRGASRYYSDQYKQAFGLECEAIKRVREQLGFTNVIPMVPFCRTPDEGKKVLETMKEFGLVQGEHGLQVYVMCEIPSNVILAEDFAQLFDGFSIGTNDLTQLTLGLDRDSSAISHLYDENNTAVKKLVREVIRVAHKHKRKVGLCGQAPSDSPEFADFLVECGIDSMSLNPDTIVSMKRRVAELERTIGRKGHTTHRGYLSAVIGMGVTTIVGLALFGGGCVDVSSTEVSIDTLPSPSVLREKAMEKGKQDALAMMNRYEDQTFGALSFLYPSFFSLSRENMDTLLLTHRDTGEVISLTKKPLSSFDVASSSFSDVIGGKQASIMKKENTTVVTIMIDTNTILDIVGPSSFIESFAQTIVFFHDASLCAQVITYAQASPTDSCIAYPTPCDVPDTWRVCE